MKLQKFAILAVVALGSLLLGACTGNTRTAHQKSTAFGLYTFEPASYQTGNEMTGAVVRTDEISGMELPSGDRLELFWGLISIEDY